MKKSYFKTHRCKRCGVIFEEDKPHPNRSTGRWVCDKCKKPRYNPKGSNTTHQYKKIIK
ncbi:hypothetical protein KKG81_12970 [bacterium]|nr:hypothetical protein [bacterium]